MFRYTNIYFSGWRPKRNGTRKKNEIEKNRCQYSKIRADNKRLIQFFVVADECFILFSEQPIGKRNVETEEKIACPDLGPYSTKFPFVIMYPKLNVAKKFNKL